MHHRPDTVPREKPLQRSAIAHVALDERDTPAGDALDAADHVCAAVGKVVQNHNLAASGQQLDAGVRADVAGAARYEDLFIHCRSPVRWHDPAALRNLEIWGQTTLFHTS